MKFRMLQQKNQLVKTNCTPCLLRKLIVKIYHLTHSNRSDRDLRNHLLKKHG